MNLNSIQILFLKDLFLSRRQMFAYLLAGFIASVVAALPNRLRAPLSLLS